MTDPDVPLTRQGGWWPVLDADAFTVPRELDVLVPTRERPIELAATLAGLAGQRSREPFGVLVSDQSDGPPAWSSPAVAAMVRVLAYGGHPVRLVRHLPRRGLAEHRASLLAASAARFVLFLDDDVWLEPDVADRLLAAVRSLRCGFVGNAPHGLSFHDDVREHQQVYEEWPGPPRPESVSPDGPEAARAALHSAANLAHLTASLDLASGTWRAYQIAWIGACVPYDRVRRRHRAEPCIPPGVRDHGQGPRRPVLVRPALTGGAPGVRAGDGAARDGPPRH